MTIINQAIDFKALNICINDLKIRVKIVEMQKLKAIVGIDFGDFVIKGFRVNLSDYKNEDGEELWVVPPSYRDSGGRYHPIFYIPDKDLWIDLQRRIIVEYKKESEKHFNKRMDIED